MIGERKSNKLSHDQFRSDIRYIDKSQKEEINNLLVKYGDYIVESVKYDCLSYNEMTYPAAVLLEGALFNYQPFISEALKYSMPLMHKCGAFYETVAASYWEAATLLLDDPEILAYARNNIEDLANQLACLSNILNSFKEDYVVLEHDRNREIRRAFCQKLNLFELGQEYLLDLQKFNASIMGGQKYNYKDALTPTNSFTPQATEALKDKKKTEEEEIEDSLENSARKCSEICMLI